MSPEQKASSLLAPFHIGEEPAIIIIEKAGYRLKLGYTVKYSLSPREIPRAPPSGFPSCSGYKSPYSPPLVII